MKFKLVVENHVTKEENDITIFSNGFSKKEAELYEIDLFLLTGLGKGFGSKEEFINTLNKLGDDYSVDDEIFIKYENRGERKFKPLFGNHLELNYIAYICNEVKLGVDEIKNIRNKEHQIKAKENIKKTFKNDPILNEIISGFYNGIKKYEYRQILSEMKFSQRYLDAIETYIRIKQTYNADEVFSKNYAKSELEKMLNSYKNLRRVILSLKEYNNKYYDSLGVDFSSVSLKLEELRNKESAYQIDIYEIAKNYQEELQFAEKDPDLIRSDSSINPFDHYSIEDLEENGILTKETYDMHFEEYSNRLNFQNIKK